jgi:hypothetical protein
LSQRSSIAMATANNITEKFVTMWLRLFCRRLREMIRSSLRLHPKRVISGVS